MGDWTAEFSKTTREDAAVRFLELLSCLLNVLCGGDPDESFSARAARTGSPWESRIDRVLGEGHCALVHVRTRRRQMNRYGVKA